MNNTTLIGRITQDITLKTTDSGYTLAKFFLAVDKGLSKEKRQAFEAEGRPTADFIPCIAWGQQAETLKQYTKKGDRLGVVGHVETGRYTDKEGVTRYTFNVRVHSFQFLESASSEDTPAPQQEAQGYNTYDMDEIPF